MRYILIALFLFPTTFPVEKIREGYASSIPGTGTIKDEIKRMIPAVPKEKPILSIQNVALKITVEKDIGIKGPEFTQEKFNRYLNESQKWTLVTYQKLVPSNCKGCTGGPYWFIFDEHNKLFVYDKGYEEVADFWMYKEAVDLILFGKAITHKKGEVLKYDKFKSVLRNNPFLPAFDELWKFRIMMATKIDKGKINVEEYDYSVAQKLRELMERVKLEYLQGGISAMENLILFQTFRSLLPRTYIITPYGQGFTVQER